MSLLMRLKSIVATTETEIDGKRCSVCNSVLRIVAKQTRSADEGMTIYAHCQRCVKTFKI